MAIQKQKVLFFEAALADFFKKAGRSELPWRKKNISAYEVWVSEVMLQQTQVSRVITYYQRFLKKFSTVQKLAKADWEEFLAYYEGLGYYARGRNMLRAAQVVTEKHQGLFPKTKEELIELPGVGDYTAAAILSFAYNKQALAWDTNLKRVIGRFFYGTKKADIDTSFFEQNFNTPRKKLNAALMDFGSLICTGKPKCLNCPLQNKCVYFKERGKQERGAVKNKEIFPTQQASVVVFLHQNHQVYFSSARHTYKAFFLPKGFVTRVAVKDWFLQEYNLRVSVRPPHQKTWHQQKPVLLMNAQILLGEHQLRPFPKKTVTEYTKSNF